MQFMSGIAFALLQVEMSWLLLFRHIAGFMRSGYPMGGGRAPVHNRTVSTSSVDVPDIDWPGGLRRPI